MTVFMVDIPANFHKRVCLREQISCNMERDIDAKERADRMAAAEAMSALSSIVVTHTGDSPPPRAKRAASRGRGRGRGRGRRTNSDSREVNSDSTKSRSRSRTNHDMAKTGVTEKARNRPTRMTTSKAKLVNNEGQEPKRSPRRRSKNSMSESESPKKARTRTKSQNSDYGEMPVLEAQVSSTPSLPSLPSNLTLTLPSLNIPSLGTLPTLGSLPLFQTDLNNDKQPKKQDNKTLPFKKRRLINSEQDGEESDDQDSRPEKNFATDSVPSTPSLSSKLQIDPSQQIRLFGEIQAALTADEDGDIPLHLAVVHEHLPLVQKFIQLLRIAKRSVDRFNKDKQTPLHLAVKLNFLAGVRALLDAGADVNFVDKTGCSSLHLAVKHQLPECLKMLVNGSKAEADFNTRNFEGLTPLHTAVELRNMQLMHFILERHADINMTDGKSGRTALFHAAENNQEEIVDYLLKRGANPDILNYAGSTAIMAAQARNYNIVTKMLSRVSDWMDDDRSGSSSPVSEISVYIPDQHGPKNPRLPVRIPLYPVITAFPAGALGQAPAATVNSGNPGQTRPSGHSTGSPGKPATSGNQGSPSQRGTSGKTPGTSGKTPGTSGKHGSHSQSRKSGNIPGASSQPGTSRNNEASGNLVPSGQDKAVKFKPSETTQSRSPGKLTEASSETVTNVDDNRKASSSSSCQTPIHDVGRGKKGTNEPKKPEERTKPPEKKQPGLINSEFNTIANLKAISELAKRSPQVAFELQKLYEAKQRQLQASRAPSEESAATSVPASTSSKAATPISKPVSTPSPRSVNDSPKRGNASPKLGNQTKSPRASPKLAYASPKASKASPGPSEDSPKPVNLFPRDNASPRASSEPTKDKDESESISTVSTPVSVPATVPSQGEAKSGPRTVPAPSQVIGKVSHVVDKQQPERIISTGMVVEHPEYGLVFRPFGPGGQIQHLSQSRPGTPGNQESGSKDGGEVTDGIKTKDCIISGEDSPVLSGKSVSRTDSPTNSVTSSGNLNLSRQGTPNSSRPATPSNSRPATPNSRPATPGKQSSRPATPSNKNVTMEVHGNQEISSSMVKEGEVMKEKEKRSGALMRLTQKARIVSETLQESRSKSPIIIPFSQVSSYPVTEKLLNSKPKSLAIPNPNVPEKTVKLQEAPKDSNVKTIANSAIAAKLRQRVLNAPHVDTATKSQTISPVSQPMTIQPRGVVTTAPERVPKLPQFASKQVNSKSDDQSSNSDSSTVSEQSSAVDLTKSKTEKTKKTERRKKKEPSGEGKKKSIKGDNSVKGDNSIKGDNSKEKESPEPMDTS